MLRYITVRRVLAEAGEAIERFVNSGLAELGDKLGPLLWQFGPTKKFDPEDFERFLKLLPAKTGGIRLRHALEVRHPSFANPEFIALARAHGAAVVFADSDEYQSFADLTSDFVYARLMKADAKVRHRLYAESAHVMGQARPNLGARRRTRRPAPYR